MVNAWHNRLTIAEPERNPRTHIGTLATGDPGRTYTILRERMLAEEPRTLADMGEEFGVSRERVRQLEARLVRSLREHMKEHLVDFEYYGPPKDG